MQLGDCSELIMVDRGGGIFHRTGEKFERMDDAIALADSGLG